MSLVCVMFAFFIGKSSYHQLTVPVYSDLPEQERSTLINELNQSELFSFEYEKEKNVKAAIRKGEAEAGLQLKEKGFTLVTGAYSENAPLLQRYIQGIYTKKLQKEHVLAASQSTGEREKVESIWEEALEQPLIKVEKENFRNAET
ncbi:hypothetical protein J2Z23_000969 [Lederbergia galactosidilyticus]|nr:hypothetical protein [Lederbergia galactosidilytica]